MKKIYVRHGANAVSVSFIDEENEHLFTSRKWHVDSSGYVASRNNKNVYERIHRIIVGASKGQVVDHIDGNKLNNTKSNLRICSNAQNLANRGPNKNNSSGKKGVYFCKRSKKWIAQIGFDNKRITVGSFSDLNEAAEAYEAAATRIHKEFARTE